MFEPPVLRGKGRLPQRPRRKPSTLGLLQGRWVEIDRKNRRLPAGFEHLAKKDCERVGLFPRGTSSREDLQLVVSRALLHAFGHDPLRERVELLDIAKEVRLGNREFIGKCRELRHWALEIDVIEITGAVLVGRDQPSAEHIGEEPRLGVFELQP